MNGLADEEAERMVLGAVILSNALLGSIEGVLKPEHFARDEHKAIYRSMLALSEGGHPIDYLTLRDDLIGDADTAYIHGLTDGLPRIKNVEEWASRIRDKARRRRAVKLGERLTQQALSVNVTTDELLDRHQASLAEIMVGPTANVQPLADVLDEAVSDLQSFAESATGLTGIPTGIPKFDRSTGGLQAGGLYILGAYTGRGKSAMSSQIAIHAALRGKRVLVFSMEMPPRQVAVRMLLADSGVDKWDLRPHAQDNPAWGAVIRSQSKLAPLWVWMDRTEAPNLAHVRATTRRLKAQHGLDLVVFDYLQRATVDPKLDRWLAVGEIARGLKGLAMASQVAVWAPCQLNAEAENQRPGLHNLGQAQSIISAEADLVAFLNPDDLERWKSQPFPAVTMWVDKFRHGPSFKVELSFERAHSRFVETTVPYPVAVESR